MAIGSSSAEIRRYLLAIAMASALCLGACFGGDPEPTPTPEPTSVPSTATPLPPPATPEPTPIPPVPVMPPLPPGLTSGQFAGAQPVPTVFIRLSTPVPSVALQRGTPIPTPIPTPEWDPSARIGHVNVTADHIEIGYTRPVRVTSPDQLALAAYNLTASSTLDLRATTLDGDHLTSETVVGNVLGFYFNAADLALTDEFELLGYRYGEATIADESSGAKVDSTFAQQRYTAMLAPIPTRTAESLAPVAPTVVPPAAVPTAMAATAEDVARLAEDNSAFALDIFTMLNAQTSGNLIISPYSISHALAMIYAGVRGQTEQQIADTLRWSLPQDVLHPAFGFLSGSLASAGQDAGASEFRLKVANSIWAQEGYEFDEQFTSALKRDYDAPIRHVDFINNPELSRMEVNRWVAEATEGKVQEIIPSQIYHDTESALTLVSAMYFDAEWERAFEKVVAPPPFNLLNGDQKPVQMIDRADGEERTTGYFDGDKYQAVKIDYRPSRMSMTILMPDPGNFWQFLTSLDGERLSRIMNRIEQRNVYLVMPTFEFSSTFALTNRLPRMGMPSAFDPTASDFSGMDGRSCAAAQYPCIYIKNVMHQAFVAVDEKGTEAAAAVVTGIERDAPEQVDVLIDRPFVFLIRDEASGTLLFMGRVIEP